MAKISRNALKGLVKECLVEILNEGMGNKHTAQASMESSRYPIKESRSQSRKRNPAKRSASLDNVSYNSAAADERKKEAVDALTEDPLMASIFADTHNTTMMSQGEGRGSMNESVALQGDMAARAMSQNDPSDVFGDAASNWAHLAFSEK